MVAMENSSPQTARLKTHNPKTSSAALGCSLKERPTANGARLGLAPAGMDEDWNLEWVGLTGWVGERAARCAGRGTFNKQATANQPSGNQAHTHLTHKKNILLLPYCNQDGSKFDYIQQ